MRKNIRLKTLAVALVAQSIVVAPLAIAAPQMDKQAIKEQGEATALSVVERTKDGALAQVESELIEITAVIEDINHPDRELTVKGPDGIARSLKVSKDVKRFDEFKPGDKIVVEYLESLAFEVRKPTKEELANPRQVFASAEKFDKQLPPGVEVDYLSHTIVEITAIDMEKQTVTLKLPEGDEITIKAKYPENLKRVKKGDTVAVTFASAVAMSLAPAKG